MKRPRSFAICGGISLVVLSGVWVSRADDDSSSADVAAQLAVEHPECVFFSGAQERFMDVTVRPRNGRTSSRLGAMTEQVVRMLGYVPGGSRTYAFDQTHQAGSIDS